jgi:hypothetical protein
MIHENMIHENMIHENMIHENMIHFIKSITLNYKSWLCIFASIYVIESENYIKAVFTFFLIMFLAYYIHYCSHLEYFFPYNLTHIEHHNHNNWFSHIIEIILEGSICICASSVNNLIGVLNGWIILYFYLFYTTVHNINYSIFHVNSVHEKHHLLLDYNYGPDIFDVLFNTKKNPEHDLENTDHYIWNIILLTPLVFCMKSIYKNLSSEWKIKIKYMMSFVSMIIFTIIAASTADLYIDCGGTYQRK